MARTAMFLYSIGAYALFLLAFLYLVAFVAGVGVPRSVDAGLEADMALALAIDLALIALFAVQHTIMARPRFKRWLTQWLPAPMERSTFVLASSLVLMLLMAQWRPIPPCSGTSEAARLSCCGSCARSAGRSCCCPPS